MKQMIVLEWNWLFLTIAPCDAAEPWQLGSQDAASPMMQGIMDLHHDIFFFLILILVFVLWILVRALWHFLKKWILLRFSILHMEAQEARRRANMRLWERLTGGGSGLPEAPERRKRKRDTEVLLRGRKNSLASILKRVHKDVFGGAEKVPSSFVWKKAVRLYIGVEVLSDDDLLDRLEDFSSSLMHPEMGYYTNTAAFYAVYQIAKDLM